MYQQHIGRIVCVKNGWNHDFINHQSGGDCEINCDDEEKKTHIYLLFFVFRKKNRKRIFLPMQRHELSFESCKLICCIINQITKTFGVGWSGDFSPFSILFSLIISQPYFIFFFTHCVGLNIYQLIIICDIFLWVPTIIEKCIRKKQDEEEFSFFAIYV